MTRPHLLRSYAFLCQGQGRLERPVNRDQSTLHNSRSLPTPPSCILSVSRLKDPESAHSGLFHVDVFGLLSKSLK